jgi:hypothetical protein
MEKRTKGVMNKGSGSVDKVVKKLVSDGTITTNESTFKKVLNALRTTYAKLIENKSVSLDYGNFEITLN